MVSITRYCAALLSLGLHVMLVAQPTTRCAGAVAPTRADVMAAPREQPRLGNDKAPLPAKVDLSLWFPPAGDQWKQSSCSGWALGYALATYHRNRAQGREADTTFLADPAAVYSPAFVYDLVTQLEKNPSCTTSVSLWDAIQVVCDTGCVAWQLHPYDSSLTACLRPVPTAAIQAAQARRMSHPVSIDNRNYDQWRAHLAEGEPVVFQVSIGGFFDQGFATHGKGPFVWNEPKPTQWEGRLGHIMVCTGYEGDTMIALNSWGTGWGERGYVRIPTSTLYWACSDAYVIQPGAAPAFDPVRCAIDTRQPRRDQIVRGGLGHGEVHGVGDLLYRVLCPALNDGEQVVEFLDAHSLQRLHTLSICEDRPCTLQHNGELYTFTYTGKRLFSRQLRYRLVKNDPAQVQALQRELDHLDVQNDGVRDGRW
jgi:hypothetical protein